MSMNNRIQNIIARRLDSPAGMAMCAERFASSSKLRFENEVSRAKSFCPYCPKFTTKVIFGKASQLLRSPIESEEINCLVVENFTEDKHCFFCKHESLMDFQEEAEEVLKDIAIQTPFTWCPVLYQLADDGLNEGLLQIKLNSKRLVLLAALKEILLDKTDSSPRPVLEKNCVHAEVQYEGFEPNHKMIQTGNITLKKVRKQNICKKPDPDPITPTCKTDNICISEIPLQDNPDTKCPSDTRKSLSQSCMSISNRHSSQCCCIDCITKVD